MKINLDSLEYKGDLIELAKSMQYAFATNPQSDYEKDTQRYWLGNVFINSKKEICYFINETKKQYFGELEQSPLLHGLLDMYIAASNTTSTEQLKDIYLAYQELQKDIPFEKHKQAYIDAGCKLSTDLYDQDTDKLFLSYPIHLFSSYAQHGGESMKHRGGYLYPVHELSIEELKELSTISPDLFQNENVFKTYQNMILSVQSTPNNSSN